MKTFIRKLSSCSILMEEKIDMAAPEAKAGVQVSHKYLKTLDSGLAVIPDSDPGRNDGKRCFLTFYEILNFDLTSNGN